MRPRAFTLVELLVVIGIIALLISVLMPALRKARYSAQEVVCLSNMRQMMLAQIMYASANKGKFPAHRSFGPHYVRDDFNNVPRQSPWWQLNEAYITDPNITTCPFFAGLHEAWGDPFYIDPGSPDYGSWAANTRLTFTSYNFFANWVPAGASPAGTTNPEPYIDFATYNEKRWPRNAAECSSESVMMSHQFHFHQSYNGGWDGGHGDRQLTWNPVVPTESRQLFTRSAPVGYADGHAEVHQKDFIKCRARVPNDGGYLTTYYWY